MKCPCPDATADSKSLWGPAGRTPQPLRPQSPPVMELCPPGCCPPTSTSRCSQHESTSIKSQTGTSTVPWGVWQTQGRRYQRDAAAPQEHTKSPGQATRRHGSEPLLLVARPVLRPRAHTGTRRTRQQGAPGFPCPATAPPRTPGRGPPSTASVSLILFHEDS